MNKSIIALSILCGFTAFAQEAEVKAEPKVTNADRLGGFVLSPVPEGSKYVVITDKTEKGNPVAIAEFLKKVTVSAHLAGKIVPATDELLANKNGDLVIALVDSGDFTVYPDKRVALVPVTSTDIQKSLWQAFVILTTSGKTSPQSVMAIAAGAKDQGIPMVRRVPYKLACEQGWAPAPTNDYQKAIWEAAKTNKTVKATAPAAPAAEAK